MDEGGGGELEPAEKVELVSDGENLLVLGQSRRSVEGFLRSKGLLEKAHEVRGRQVVAALRSSGELVRTVAETVAASSLWLKITPDSAEAIKEYGLVESGVPGVAYAMAGTRGSIRQWIKIDATAGAQVSNPGMLSGAAGVLSQAARQQEAVELRTLLESLDHKLDRVLRGQKDDILGDLSGIESQIRATRRRLDTEGEIDALTWSTLFGTSLGLRQLQAKALRKLQGIADDLASQSRFSELHRRLQEAKGEVQLWLSVVARCVTALDELAVLELDYCAALDPSRFDARRAMLDSERQEDRLELHKGISVLLQRMDDASRSANQNKLFHQWGVPKALSSIDEARNLVKLVYGAFGVEIKWDLVDPIRWRDAVREVQQWRNGLQEGGSLAWEKGAPIVGPLALGALVTVAAGLLKGKLDPDERPQDHLESGK